jgi:Polyketide cyclase / dehydrase and lipid transport
MRSGPDSVPVDFDITTEWILEAQPEELTDIVLDPEHLHLWCPSVFLQSEVVEKGGLDGLGLTVRIQSKGWLPHSFFCQAEIIDLVPHQTMDVQVSGDFEGIGRLAVEPGDDGLCRAVLHWRTNIRHPYIRPLVPVLHPLFVLNHKWAMRKARAQMQAEVDRRRKGANAFPSATPTFPHNLAFFRRRRARATPLPRTDR